MQPLSFRKYIWVYKVFPQVLVVSFPVCRCVLTPSQRWHTTRTVYFGSCMLASVCVCVCGGGACDWHPVATNTVIQNKGGKRPAYDISWFWQAPCQGEIVSDVLLRCFPLPKAVYMKLVLFSTSSPFPTWRQAGEERWLLRLHVSRNWTASPHYCKHHPRRHGWQLLWRRTWLPWIHLLKHIH